METRLFTQATELRASEKELRIGGYAAVYETPSHPIQTKVGSFIEKIAKGAFRSIMKTKPDVVMLLNHDQNVVLGRTTSGTLVLKDDSHGLKFDCLLPSTPTGRDVHESVKRGDLAGCSFAFQVDEDEWSEEKSVVDRAITYAKRVIKSFKNLMDVSIVTQPAYPGTEVFTRSNAVAAEVRSMVQYLTEDNPWRDACRRNGIDPELAATRAMLGATSFEQVKRWIQANPSDSIRRRKVLLSSVLI